MCPAYGKICGKCGKPNHFAAVCKSTRDTGQKLKQHRSQRKRDIRRIDESKAEESEGDTDQDSDFLDESVRHLAVGKVKISKVSDSDKTVPITINDVIVKMEPDSGADVNVMDEHQYRALQRKTGFGGPYPDGHYNLVIIDKRTRFPIVEQTTSTPCRVTCDKLRAIFAMHGIPERIETDNGPPFSSTEFKEFSEEKGLHSSQGNTGTPSSQRGSRTVHESVK